MFHGFCLYYNRLENHSQWDKFTRFRSFLCAFFTVDIVVYNILFAIKYKISQKLRGGKLCFKKKNNKYINYYIIYYTKQNIFIILSQQLFFNSLCRDSKRITPTN